MALFEQETATADLLAKISNNINTLATTFIFLR
jgi:hypothetical protein